MRIGKAVRYTVREAAEILNVLPSTVRSAVNNHGIGEKIDPKNPKSTYFLTEKDIAFIGSRLNKVGRPKTKKAGN